MGRAARRTACRSTEGIGAAQRTWLGTGGLGVRVNEVSGADLGGLAALQGAVDSPRRAMPATRAEALVLEGGEKVQGNRRSFASRGRRGKYPLCVYGRQNPTTLRATSVTG